MAPSTPEMSQLLEAATRLFLFTGHSVIQESSSEALPKGTDISWLSPPSSEAALRVWAALTAVQGVGQGCRGSISSGEPWEVIPDVTQPRYCDNKGISGRKLLTNPLCLRWGGTTLCCCKDHSVQSQGS